MANSSEAPQTLGFCSVRSHADHGYVGGYLILNTHARPLEFHCTLPVKPSRAQEILYGRTLADFVCGEQIAKALVSKAKLTPSLIVTDCTSVLALAHACEHCVVCVDAQSQSMTNGLHIPSTDPSRLKSTRLGEYSVHILCDDLQTESRLDTIWKQLDTQIDLLEPFQRIGEALLEAHPIMKAA